jgi:hypothetical protein
MYCLSVKLCFVMDCTASMEPWIRTARHEVLSIIKSIEGKHPHADIRVAFVGYRDHGDDERILLHNFSDVPALYAYLHTVVAKGGDDGAEDVAGGLRQAHSLSWDRADLCLLYHIADAPAHGTLYHNEDVSDNYPEGDPFGLDPATILRQFATDGVQYTFVRITHHTDRMLDIFENVYRRGPGRFSVLDMAGRSRHVLASQVYTALDETITQYSASQGLAVE